MTQFQKTYENWRTLNKQLFTDCENYLKEVLSTVPDNSLDLSSDNENVHFDMEVSVSYNGGRHPEYDSNCYSTVYRVFLKDGKVYLDTEDSDEYSINEITADELHNVAELVFCVMNPEV